MDDMISRQAAIETVRKAQSIGQAHRMLLQLPSAQPNLDEWCDDCKEYDKERHSYPRWNRVIRETVEDMKAAQPGWIPVTEKPIECGQYIVTLKDDKEVWTDIAEWNPTFGGRWQAGFFDCEYRDIDNVVAWQPLPTPYREGGQE